MAQIHISKDPSDKTPVACVYAPLTRCIVLVGLGKTVNIYMAHFNPEKGRLRQENGLKWNVYHDIKWVI